MARPGLRVAYAALGVAIAALCVIAAGAPGTTSGYIAAVRNTADAATTAANFTCAGAVGVDKSNAMFEYYLNEASGATKAIDYASGSNPGTYVNGLTGIATGMTSSSTTPIACPRDTGGAWVLNGTSNTISYPTSFAGPTTFSLEAWFKTTATSGKIIGFGSSQVGLSGQYDRHLYVSGGSITFGVYNGGYDTITSPLSYNDGLWHQVVATFSPTANTTTGVPAGMALYVDNKLVAFNTSYTVAESHSGYWRIGYDNLGGWPNAGTNYYFTGSMRFVAAYTTALTPAQINLHYLAGVAK